MDEPLDEQYLVWLYSKVASIRVTNPRRTYWALFRQLFTREFVWLVPNDDNRVEDGLDLRTEFLADKRISNPDDHWMTQGCSVLEMLIALSRRLSFEDGETDRNWFWHLLDNLGLGNQSDNKHDPEFTEEVVERLIWRNYEPNGQGGLFPLKGACPDQRNIEIWYQLCAYILERE